MTLREALGPTSARVALAVSAIAGLAMCASPLTGVHGVESGLVLGVLLPPFIAVAAARLVIARRRRGVGVDVGASVAGALKMATLVVGVPILVLWVDSLRIRQCTPGLGLSFMILGPVAGCCAAAVLGALVSVVIRPVRIATAVAVLMPLVAVGTGLYRFWSSPAIFVYGLFAGWFPGTIYDEGTTIPVTYITFRVGTFALCAGLVLLARHALSRSDGGLALHRLAQAPFSVGLGLLLLGGAGLIHVNGETLGHRSSAQFIAEELGATSRGERCIIHAPRETRRAVLARLVADCDFRVEQSEEILGVTQREPVTAFFFRSADEKRRYMGAGNTFIAEPWRNEVYLQLRGWPHPVLFHEVVHVIAGNTASGPFQVGGQLGGYLPDPSLIEGVAVAVAWHERDGLTPHQWSRAMVELDLMPPLSDVFGLSFLGQPARNAYTISGSFIRHLLDEHGAEVVREAYRTGDIEAAAGVPLAELERAWRARIDEEPFPEEALALARVRFERASIFSAVCPHEVARLRQRLGADLAAGDADAAVSTCEELLTIDPADIGTRARYAGVLARAGRDEDASATLADLEGDPPAPAPYIVLGHEMVADAEWIGGDTRGAARRYRSLLDRPQTEGARRNLEVKLLAAEEMPEVDAQRILDMLIGHDGVPTDRATGVHHDRELGASRLDGLGPYLEARQLMASARYDLALPRIRESEARGLPTELLERESRRMLGATLIAEGELDEARALFESIRDHEGATVGDRVVAGDWLERIEYLRAQ